MPLDLSAFVDRMLIEEGLATVWQSLSARVRAEAVERAAADMKAFAERDPSQRGSIAGIMVPHSPFQAVLAHRVAHAMWGPAAAADRPSETPFGAAAITVAHRARSLTGVDIHPAARIGARLIIDHGYGTVIGETSILGDDVYILNGVVIGARGIAGNASGRRHPSIGDRVEIGAYACVLGAIEIGDDSFIGPQTFVTASIPSNSRIVVVNRLQIETRGGQPPGTRRITGFRRTDDGNVTLFGKGLDDGLAEIRSGRCGQPDDRAPLSGHPFDGGLHIALSPAPDETSRRTVTLVYADQTLCMDLSV